MQLQPIILVFHVLLALGLIALVLIQHGRGADMGAAFGAGASGSVFGSRGAGTFMSRVTGILAALFFLTSLGLAYLSTTAVQSRSVSERIAEPAPAQEEVTVEPEMPSDDEVPPLPAE
jgi:preprotein translocase subunit SecG